MGAESNNPLNVFSCYASEDHHWYQQLYSHLSNLQRQNLIRLGDESLISAGSEWRKERLKLFNSADIVILLISPDFLASENCYQDMEGALALQRMGKVRVVPLLVRPVESEEAPFQALRCLPTNEMPITEWGDSDKALKDIAKGLRLVVNELRESSEKSASPSCEDSHQDDPELLALVTDQSGFMGDRLESFVGRESELADIRHKIDELMAKGGYITLTGQAGQGKSSMIAKLIQCSDPQKVAHHFIPLNPGPDHQVVLLRNVMARLILKYRLSSLYVSSESRPALCDFFPKVLKEISALKGQEVIFIDGLDQLEEDSTGIRDLSFLPNRLPPGIVFVLGTRPNDTLRPLELLNPHREYPLPNMSRTDFDHILARRGVTLRSSIADRFYDAMEQNALYLDLVAKELHEATSLQPDEIIQRLSSNPEHLFTLAIERLQRQTMLWEKVIYPMLGILLVAREPLHRQHLAQLLGVQDYRCREGLMKLGGLVIVDGQQKCSLFHLKLRDYLRQDEQSPEKEYLFSLQEETNWHKVMAEWCEGKDINRVWEEAKSNWIERERRKYAQQHYITHLYYAEEHEKLFDVLDQSEFGQRKLKIDPSTRSYVQDLDWGRKAAGNDKETFEVQLERLPRLWRYTLLRCSLASRVDQYPVSAFKLLVLLGRQQEALGLAELITEPERKAQVLLEIASQRAVKSELQTEALKIVLRAREIAETIGRLDARDKALCEVGYTLTQLRQWEKACEVFIIVEDELQQSKGLRYLVNTLIQKQKWDDAKQVIDCIWVRQQRGEALDELGKALAKAHLWQQAHSVIGTIWESQQKVKALANLGLELVRAEQKGQAKKMWVEARRTVRSIRSRWERASVLRELGTTLAQARQQEEASVMWAEAREIINSFQDGKQQAQALRELGTALAQAQQWAGARAVINCIQDRAQQAEALRELGTTLAQARQWAEACEVAKSIQDRDQQAWALQELATALAQNQQLEEAREVARSIQDREQQVQALRELGMALAQARQWAEAREVAKSIQDKGQQARVLRELGMALVQTQRWEEACEVAKSIQDREQQVWALRELGIALAQAQQWAEARIVINHIQDREQQAEALRELGIALAQAQQWAEAHIVINHIQDREQQAEALRELGIALAKAQQWQEAREVINSVQDRKHQAQALQNLETALVQTQQWTEARQVINSIQDREHQVAALRGLGAELAQAQQWTEANVIWAEARQVINTLPDGREQAWALRDLGIALAQAQQWAEARQIINSIQHNGYQAWALRELGIALAQAQQWAEARQIINSIQYDRYQAWALRELGIALAQAQQWAEARQVINSIHDREKKSQALREFATALARAQQWAEARQVINSIQGRGDYQAAALQDLGTALAQAQEWAKAHQVINSIHDMTKQLEALQGLGRALAQAQRRTEANAIWTEARELIDSIQDREKKSQALQELGKVLARAQQWQDAREVIDSIQDREQRAQALQELSNLLASAHEYKQLLHLIQQTWLNTETRADAIQLFPLATGLVVYRPSLSLVFCQSFTWVDQFMSGENSDI